MNAGNWAAARAAIAQSIPLIDQTIAALRKRALEHEHGEHDSQCDEDNETVEALLAVRKLKERARDHAHESSGAKALDELADAIKTEVHLADAAAARGHAL